MSGKRRSAFSVFNTESKIENNEQKNVNEIKNKFDKNKKNHFLNFNGDKINEKSFKKHSDKQKFIKKENKKFSRLSNESIFSSLNLYNNNNNNNNNNQNKKNISKQKNGGSTSKNLNIQTTKLSNAKEKEKNIFSTKQNKIEEIPFDKNEKNNSILESPFDSTEEDETNEMFDSRQEAIKLFKKIIHPIKVKEFFNEYWEKKPLLIKRSNPNYYNNWITCKDLDKILRNNEIEFTTNIDVVSYVNGVKSNHNPAGRAYAPLVWDLYQQGCSVRFLNPQTYSKNIWKYLSTLQELFSSCVGANLYLTPPGTQGFAPHYDDIEAFVIQLEGRKHWRVYKPLSEDSNLARFSSRNFKQDEIGEPVIDCIIESGDLLYFPRGFVHQANACDDIHSLHITVSSYQLNSWGDFLLKLLPGTIEVAMSENIDYRRGLPLNYSMNNGIVFDEKKTIDRQQFIQKTKALIKNLVKYAPIDAAVDQMAKQYIFDSMPPKFTLSEKSRSIHGHGEKWNAKKNTVDNISEIEPDTSIKLIRRNCLRLVHEDNTFMIYHNLDNSKVYREKESSYLEVDENALQAVEFLIQKYPQYVTVDELPLEKIDEKIVLASCLYDKGLLVTGEPLISQDDNDSDECDCECECEADDSHEDNESFEERKFEQDSFLIDINDEEIEEDESDENCEDDEEEEDEDEDEDEDDDEDDDDNDNDDD